MFWSLTLDMAERISVVATAAFILSRWGAFGRLLARKMTRRDRLLLSVALGLLGILGTYGGIPVAGALANSRVVGIMVAGLLGGPWVGLGAGLIAGLHRYMLGGFTASACAVAALVEGALGGLVRQLLKTRLVSWPVALAAGAVGEALQMAIILLLSHPFRDAWALVRVIGLPMVIVNSLGIATFVLVTQTTGELQDRIAARQAQQTLRIAAQTLPYLRQGLTRESAGPAARIIYEALNVTAVAITDDREILAHVGAGSDHHHAGNPIQTIATLMALGNGEVQVAQSRQEIGCQGEGCGLGSAVVAPLKRG
ncbi:MAG: LytS/YhcK type 5TM receptor domain-containing protein, partial [Mycobacterium leprae]